MKTYRYTFMIDDDWKAPFPDETTKFFDHGGLSTEVDFFESYAAKVKILTKTRAVLAAVCRKNP